MRLELLLRDHHADPTTLEHPDFLLRLGEGRLEETDDNDVFLPSYVNTSETLSELCSALFEGIEEHWNDTDCLTSRAVLVTKNIKLGDINEIVGFRIPGEIKTYPSADSVGNNDLQAQVSAEIRYPQELLKESDAGSSMPDHCLNLKKVHLVMLLRNLRPNKGHVNGARYVVEGTTDNVLHLRSFTGAFRGERMALTRVKCHPGDHNFPTPGFTRIQCPVLTCLAMATNKSQGQSIRDRLGIDLTDSCFSHGQLYVAMLRATYPRNSYICCADITWPRTTKNIEYREVLD